MSKQMIAALAALVAVVAGGTMTQEASALELVHKLGPGHCVHPSHLIVSLIDGNPTVLPSTARRSFDCSLSSRSMGA